MKCFISGEDCQYSMDVDPRSVFVISPFGYPFDDIYGDENNGDGIAGLVSKIDHQDVDVDNEHPNIKGKLKAERADQAFQLGFVMCQRICREIQRAKFIIADISKPNPNVFYELGFSYGLNKKIILIGQKSLEKAFTFSLVRHNESYIQYRSLQDFKRTDMFLKAFKKPIVNSLNLPAQPKSKILNLINEGHTIQGLHERILNESITELKGGNNPETKPLKNNWRVETRPLSLFSRIDEITNDLEDCKICVVDSSFYGRRSTDSNPYLFFCLGLGHGLQKEVVPLTNRPASSDILPFDVRGLWHIFFKDLKELKEQFKSIMPKIDENWSEEQENYLYKRIWDPILQNGELHIMTCARDTDEEHRGPRTHIDKWDYNTVLQLVHFLALKYPKAHVNISEPISKILDNEIQKEGKEKIMEKIENQLMDKDCIIVGSPDVSDLAEIVLAKLHDIEPYKKERQKFNGYAIIKKLQPNKTSSFYWERKQNEKDCICLYKEKAGRYAFYKNDVKKGTVWGFLTIANNPFTSSKKTRKIMILSGFTGIVTCAIARLLTDDKFQDELKEMSKDYFSRAGNVEVLVGVHYSIDQNQKGDNRVFEKVFFEELISIEKKGQPKKQKAEPVHNTGTVN